MGVLEVLTIIFVVLKLVGVITWSWWLVFLPLILAFGLYILIVIGHITVFLGVKRKIDKEFDDDFFK